MSEASAPGFFGKIPSRGDFLSRRVPAGIAAAWESFLQEMTVGVRQSGAAGWQDAWLTAPLWHFTLGTRLAPPYGAAGVLVASADRVGRLFPFTLIGAASSSGDREAADWSRIAEALVMDALDEACDPANLDVALAQLGQPPSRPGQERVEGVWPVVLDGDWPVEDDAPAQPGPSQSLWWCRGSDRVAPVRLLSHGLPKPRLATAMILGGAEVTPDEFG